MRNTLLEEQPDGEETRAHTPADEAQGLAALERVGLNGENRKRFCELVDSVVEGIILIAGPEEAGRISTLCAVVRWLRSRAVKLVFLEEPEERRAAPAGGRMGDTFADLLRPVLCQDPEVIAVGELRDGVAVKIAVQAVMTGHLVLATMEAGGAQQAVNRLLNMGMEPCLIARTLKGVVSQRPVRRLCFRCRRPYTPSLDELAGLGMSPGDYLFYRGVGCEECSGGYEGVSSTFEVLAVTPAVRKAIRGQPRSGVEQAIAESGFWSIADSCRQLVLDGVTSVREVCRVLEADGRSAIQ